MTRTKVKSDPLLAMASAQGRLADTIDIFYGSADRASEGAMAANAYKRSVDELESSVSREMVSRNETFNSSLTNVATGCAVQNDDTGPRGENVRLLPYYKRHNFQEKEKSMPDFSRSLDLVQSDK